MKAERQREEREKTLGPHIVGTQRDAATAAGAEFGLAVGAEVSAAVGELGLAADAAGGSIVLLLRLLPPGLGPDATDLLLVALELLVQSSMRGERRHRG